MDGICGDASNPMNRPPPKMLRELGADGVRLVVREDADVYDYWTVLALSGFERLAVVTSETFRTDELEDELGRIAARLKKTPPVAWLLGNEPGVSDTGAVADTGEAFASDQMTPAAFGQFVRRCRGAIQAEIPGAVCVAGGVGVKGPPDDWWWEARGLLEGVVDGIDVHYPDSEDVLRTWAIEAAAMRALMTCGEWCYSGRGVTRAQVAGWLKTLRRYCAHTCWFSYGYLLSMAVVSPTTGRKLKAFGNVRAAFGAR